MNKETCKWYLTFTVYICFWLHFIHLIMHQLIQKQQQQLTQKRQKNPSAKIAQMDSHEAAGEGGHRRWACPLPGPPGRWAGTWSRTAWGWGRAQRPAGTAGWWWWWTQNPTAKPTLEKKTRTGKWWSLSVFFFLSSWIKVFANLQDSFHRYEERWRRTVFFFSTGTMTIYPAEGTDELI